MSSKIYAMLAIALLLIVAAPAGAAPEAPAPVAPAAATVPPELIGMVVRDPWYDFGTAPGQPGEPNRAAQDRMGQILAEAGVRWVRVEFIVRAGAGTWQEQVQRNDYFIDEVAPRHGIKVMGLLGFALVDIDPRDRQNGLVAKTGVDPLYGGGVNPWMRDWLERALYVAQRYRDRVGAYEVLNEQNRLPVVPGAFPGGEGVDPALTARLHTKLYRCLKQSQCGTAEPDPSWRAGVKLVLGGLHPRGSSSIVRAEAADGPPMSDRAYLGALYTSAEFASYRSSYGALPVDGLGYHPYPAEIVAGVADVASEVARMGVRLGEVRAKLRETLAATDPAAAEVPFWITEVGYNAGYMAQTSAGQTAFLRATFAALAARGDVATIFWFKYEDFPPATGPDAQRWGIVQIPFTLDSRCPGGACYEPSGEPALRRGAFFALRELAGLPVEHTALPLVRR